MKLHSLPASVLLAALVGAVHTCLLIWAWAYIGLYTPLPRWLSSHGVTAAPFQGILFSADFLINMVLCVPAGYLLCKLRPTKLLAYLPAALLPGLLWQYRLALGDITPLRDWQMFLPGAFLVLLPLPATALVIRRFVADAPNNSSKPKPLHGSA